MERARAVKTIEELMVQFERSIVEAGCGDENAIEALDDSVEAVESLRQGIKDIRVAMLYEDTGLTPDQIRELKERDTAKAPEIHKNKFSDAYTCPNCNLLVIYKDETGWFCGKHYSFCPDCGQKLKWED